LTISANLFIIEGVGAQKRAATIHDVAAAAGASISTVSRSFHMPELVRPQTRERVLEIAAGLGYVPNRAARGLITGRTGNIGLIVPDIANPFFPALVKAAQARARAKDYAVFLADTSEDPEVEAQLIRAMAKQVDGVIASSSRMTEAKLREAAALTSLVLVNRRLSGVPAVSMDMAGGIRQAVEHLHALGHRRCVYLAGPRPSWSNRQRQKALKAIAERLAIEVTVLGPFDPGYEAGLRAADQALAEGPTAIVAYNDLIALGVMARLADRGVGVPADVSVVGFDDIQMAAMASPPLTTVWAPTAAAGETAVDLLLGPGAGNGSQFRELRTELRVRSSTGPPPEAGRSSRRRSGGRRVATSARAAREE
jgi:DNA-binding LacI/PurR family transcriptional regulator